MLTVLNAGARWKVVVVVAVVLRKEANRLLDYALRTRQLPGDLRQLVCAIDNELPTGGFADIHHIARKRRTKAQSGVVSILLLAPPVAL